MDIIRDTESDSELLTRIAEGWAGKQSPTFDELSVSVLKTHQTTQASAFHAVNQMATLRNWLIGYYIVEYEQKGRDRAKYGDRLLKRLEESVDTKGLNLTLFKVSRNFYLYYPQIAELFHVSIHPMASDESVNEKGATASHQFKIATNLYFRSGVSKDPKNEIHDGDNPPIGILLCTRKGKKMVEYALAGLDNQLFVSTYMLQLPDKDTLEKFLMDEMENHSEKV